MTGPKSRIFGTGWKSGVVIAIGLGAAVYFLGGRSSVARINAAREAVVYLVGLWLGLMLGNYVNKWIVATQPTFRLLRRMGRTLVAFAVGYLALVTIFRRLGLPVTGAECLPFLWEYGIMTPLPTLEGFNGAANSINDVGEIAGVAENTTPDATCPFPQKRQFKPVIWESGTIHELQTVGGDQHGVAFVINQTGQAVGASGECSAFQPTTLVNLQPLHALLWDTGTVIDLGNLGGTGHGGGNIALNLNNVGQVVGNSDLPGDATNHAFLWTKTAGMKDLGTLPGDVISAGLAINDGGEVVGVSLDANFNLRAFHWQNGTMTDLNTLIPSGSPLALMLACSINSGGEIVGLAMDKITGEFHAYMASPGTGATSPPAAVTSTTSITLTANLRKLLQGSGLGRVGARLGGPR